MLLLDLDLLDLLHVQPLLPALLKDAVLVETLVHQLVLQALLQGFGLGNQLLALLLRLSLTNALAECILLDLYLMLGFLLHADFFELSTILDLFLCSIHHILLFDLLLDLQHVELLTVLGVQVQGGDTSQNRGIDKLLGLFTELVIKKVRNITPEVHHDTRLVSLYLFFQGLYLLIFLFDLLLLLMSKLLDPLLLPIEEDFL